MFTGIVQGTAVVKKISQIQNICQLTLAFPQESLKDLALGASIAIEGCCLTVVETAKNEARFDLIQETLNRTTLGRLSIGDHVNFERSARFGDEIGGHVVSGHIHGTVEIIEFQQPPLPCIVKFKTTPDWIQYIFSKGFIALAGTSLTVVECNKKEAIFSVHLIPETLAVTTWKNRKKGDLVNFEIDQMTLTIVDTVKQILKTMT